MAVSDGFLSRERCLTPACAPDCAVSTNIRATSGVTSPGRDGPCWPPLSLEWRRRLGDAADARSMRTDGSTGPGATAGKLGAYLMVPSTKLFVWARLCFTVQRAIDRAQSRANWFSLPVKRLWQVRFPESFVGGEPRW